MHIILDNGHGIDTGGKCSPDRRLLEYKYAREITARLEIELKKLGIPCTRIVTEENDILIPKRCSRANKIYRENGKKDTILISVHVDGLGKGEKWVDRASGWSARVSLNASVKSKELATCLESAAKEGGLKTNRQYANKAYWVQDLGICRDTHCPAVLTENLFQTNHKDVDFLLTEEGKNTIVQLHIRGIQEYIKTHQS